MEVHGHGMVEVDADDVLPKLADEELARELIMREGWRSVLLSLDEEVLPPPHPELTRIFELLAQGQPIADAVSRFAWDVYGISVVEPARVKA
jgi:hypothetical protein